MRLFKKVRPIPKLSSKKITRLESDIELNHDRFSSRLINRNPRNMEQLAFEQKPKGFWLDKVRISYWNKLIFDQRESHLDAYLMHWSGRKIITASTTEPQLKRYFNNATTTQAAIVLGKVISRRCLQSGYLYAGTNIVDMEFQGVKVKSFYDAVAENGFTLEEPSDISPRSVTDL